MTSDNAPSVNDAREEITAEAKGSDPRPTASTINDAQLDDLYYRLHQVRAAAALHGQGLLSTAELYAVIDVTPGDQPCPACPDPSSVANALTGLAQHVQRAADSRQSDFALSPEALDEPAPVSGPAATQATEPEDTCRPVEIDGETIRVRGRGEFTEREQQFAAEIVRAAKRKYAAEHREQAVTAPIVDRPFRSHRKDTP